MRHRDVRGAELFLIAGQLPRHGVKVGRKADHFCRCILDQLCLTAKLPFGDILCRIAKAAELQRQRAGVFEPHHHNKRDHHQHQQGHRDPVR